MEMELMTMMRVAVCMVCNLCVQHDGDGADDNDVSSCVHCVYLCVQHNGDEPDDNDVSGCVHGV